MNDKRCLNSSEAEAKNVASCYPIGLLEPKGLNRNKNFLLQKTLINIIAMIQPSFTSTKRNMGEIFGFIDHVYIVYIHHKDFFFEIPPCGKIVIFVKRSSL